MCRSLSVMVDNLDKIFEGEGDVAHHHISLRAHTDLPARAGVVPLATPSHLNSRRHPPSGRLSQLSFLVCTPTSAAPFTAEEEDKAGGGPGALWACTASGVSPLATAVDEYERGPHGVIGSAMVSGRRVPFSMCIVAFTGTYSFIQECAVLPQFLRLVGSLTMHARYATAEEITRITAWGHAAT